jgi:transcriptional regulator with XRE-family HTH domain
MLSDEKRADGIPTAGMIKIGRQLVGWTYADLAERSGLSIRTVQRLEDGPLRRCPAKLDKLRRAFAAAGITFARIDDRDCVCCWGGPPGDVAPVETTESGEEAVRRPAAIHLGECAIISFPSPRD